MISTHPQAEIVAAADTAVAALGAALVLGHGVLAEIKSRAGVSDLVRNEAHQQGEEVLAVSFEPITQITLTRYTWSMADTRRPSGA